MTASASVAVIASGACSPLGAGEDAFRTSNLGELAETRVVRDDELAAAGLVRPWAARAEACVSGGSVPARDRATALLEHALRGCALALDRALPGWRKLRVGAAIGTSSGGMRSFENAFDAAPGAEGAHSGTYLGPVVDAARPSAFEPFSLVLGACASSAIAVGLGRAWLLGDRCDVVLAGGFDAVSVFVAAGFESLRATCGEGGPRPFRPRRDGLALGEGAALVALVRAADARGAARAWVTGFGASCDAFHLTAPDPTGAGLARAARTALDDAGIAPSAVGLVSAHGTATVQNDAAEAQAILSVASASPVFAFKGTVGHTLGAAGALELLASVQAMERGHCPASASGGEPLPDGVRVVDRTTRASGRTALKLSSAFGGANAALVVSLDPSPAEAPVRPSSPAIYLSVATRAELADAEPATLAARTGASVDRLARADDLVRLTMAAVARLVEAVFDLRASDVGIVVGHGLATIETNAAYLARIRARGAARAMPRQFPYTTPNAAAGECAVAFGLTGPAFAVGGGPHGGIEALGVAADLVRSGGAARVVVVAVDAAGVATARIAPGTASGAVALVVSASPTDAVACLEEATVRLEAEGPRPNPLPPMTAHAPLLALIGSRPSEILAAIPWGGHARARIGWL